MMARLSIAMLVAVLPALAAAQGTIYESKDKAGPVFSDQPSPGARPLDLPPPNVIQVPPPPPQQQAAPAGPAPAYGSLAIVSPANQDTIRSNTGAFDVRVQVQPALRSGDVIRVKLDGTLLPQSFSSADFRVTDSDWAGAANPNNVEHTLQVAVASSSGALLIESAPISFFAQRAFRREGVQPRR